MAAVEPALWASLAAPERRPEGRIALGFDGSHSRDGTALVACDESGFIWPVVILERPADAPPDWRIPREHVHAALGQTFEAFDVGFLYCDPWTWQSELAEWETKWPRRVVTFPTNSTRRMAPAVDRFRSALEQEQVAHSGDLDLTRHVLNARLAKAGRDADGRGLYLLEKAGPGRLIDACVAAVLAFEAAAQIVTVEPFVTAW
jgi:hypothetical protein